MRIIIYVVGNASFFVYRTKAGTVVVCSEART